MNAAKAILKLLQHTMSLLTGKGLDFWIPHWARPRRDQFKGDRMMAAELTPVDDPNYGVLRVATRLINANFNGEVYTIQSHCVMRCHRLMMILVLGF